MELTADTATTDEELVRRYQGTGGRVHLDALVARHIGRVRSLAYGMVLNHSDADDLTQEVFLRVTKSLGQFRGNAKFATWLHRVTINTINTFFERRGPKHRELSASVAEPAERAALGPQNQLLNSEISKELAAALATLSPAIRMAMVLVVFEGMPAAEAADLAGCRTATLYWRIHEGRKILKQRLAKYLTP